MWRNSRNQGTDDDRGEKYWTPDPPQCSNGLNCSAGWVEVRVAAHDTRSNQARQDHRNANTTITLNFENLCARGSAHASVKKPSRAVLHGGRCLAIASIFRWRGEEVRAHHCDDATFHCHFSDNFQWYQWVNVIVGNVTGSCLNLIANRFRSKSTPAAC